MNHKSCIPAGRQLFFAAGMAVHMVRKDALFFVQMDENEQKLAGRHRNPRKGCFSSCYKVENAVK